MKWSRSMRLQTVVLTVFALVLSQAAIAAHACGVVQLALQSAQMAEAGLPCAGAMASAAGEAASVCHTHCQSSQGTADHFTPNVADMSQAPAVLTVALPPPLHAAAIAPERLLLRTATGPPVAIANCCFRI